MTNINLVIEGGTGVGSCDPVYGSYTEALASLLTITASPNTGYRFDSFSVVQYHSDNSPYITVIRINPFTITFSSDTTITVNFVEANPLATYDFGYLGTDATSGDRVKDRALISLTDNQYGPNGSGTSPLELACQEASEIVSGILAYYDASFVWGASPPPIVTEPLKVIISDLSISVFKRRMTPDEVSARGPFAQGMKEGDMNASGWYSQAMIALKLFIKSTYIKPAIHIIGDDGSFPNSGIGGYSER